MTSFTFTGIEVNQDPSFNITLSQSNYVRKISPIPIDINRKSILNNLSMMKNVASQRVNWITSIRLYEYPTRSLKQTIYLAITDQQCSG